MHQGMGLEAYNALPMRRAVHAVYECCYSVPLAADLARGRPYADHESLFRQADTLLFSLGEDSIDGVLQAYPLFGCRWAHRPDATAQLETAMADYRRRFGFSFVMYTADCDADTVLACIADRLHNDHETERKVVRNELARINRVRLERMLGPEGGFYNW
ncbi:OHCU decarboxylase [Mycolicibacterium wolinskyi]|uniref:2-oxo-4-hydroxy-4-carboxy-5-ureidoimidazoline decarboxylase n=2 Tax=Mycolicibacterium wolinskyi TaxID=59750 RepID=A0A132PLZ2_9MYCO|nr:2-oxo-4-hydroxy-4-carboxy-5-ureidoimidazoline decarboxylase [Mycolicibacterium wolinskyi]KWX23368.1 OHCU decarboxylase [Mycolicibacterium wolinskyi]